MTLPLKKILDDVGIDIFIKWKQDGQAEYNGVYPLPMREYVHTYICQRYAEWKHQQELEEADRE